MHLQGCETMCHQNLGHKPFAIKFKKFGSHGINLCVLAMSYSVEECKFVHFVSLTIFPGFSKMAFSKKCMLLVAFEDGSCIELLFVISCCALEEYLIQNSIAFSMSQKTMSLHCWRGGAMHPKQYNNV